MHVLARALRGHAWLAWLSLLFATQIAAADPIAGPDPDDGPDRAVHAVMRSRPLPIVTLAAAIPARNHLHPQPAAAIVVSAALGAPDGDRSAPGASTRRLEASTPFAPLQARAPPFFCFL